MEEVSGSYLIFITRFRINISTYGHEELPGRASKSFKVMAFECKYEMIWSQ